MIEEEIEKGNTDIYAENVFNKLSDKLIIIPIFFYDEFGMEINILEILLHTKKICS